MTVHKNKRNCYCHWWDNPEIAKQLRERSVPEGYCGICIRCEKPGHLRHAFAGPYSSEFCDKCFKVQGAIDVGRLILVVAVVIGAMTLLSWLVTALI